MKLILALSTIAALVDAQNLSGEPACATSCLSSAISAAGCAASDEACQCGTGQAAIGSYAAPCLIAACTNVADLGAAASVGAALCSSYSASLTSSMSSMSMTGAASPASSSMTSVSSTTESQRSTGSSVLSTASSESTTNSERSTGSSAVTTATGEATTNSERSTGSSATASPASTSSKSVGNMNKAFSLDFGMTLTVGAIVGGFMIVGAVLL